MCTNKSDCIYYNYNSHFSSSPWERTRRRFPYRARPPLVAPNYPWALRKTQRAVSRSAWMLNHERKVVELQWEDSCILLRSHDYKLQKHLRIQDVSARTYQVSCWYRVKITGFRNSTKIIKKYTPLLLINWHAIAVSLVIELWSQHMQQLSELPSSCNHSTCSNWLTCHWAVITTHEATVSLAIELWSQHMQQLSHLPLSCHHNTCSNWLTCQRAVPLFFAFSGAIAHAAFSWSLFRLEVWSQSPTWPRGPSGDDLGVNPYEVLV